MKVNFLDIVPKGYEGRSSVFTKDEFELLLDLGLDEIWYWYIQDSYEGSGQILMRKGELYDLHNAGHCSCYGPTDNINFIGKPLKELVENISEEYMKVDVKPLLEAIGYKF